MKIIVPELLSIGQSQNVKEALAPSLGEEIQTETALGDTHLRIIWQSWHESGSLAGELVDYVRMSTKLFFYFHLPNRNMFNIVLGCCQLHAGENIRLRLDLDSDAKCRLLDADWLPQ